MLRDTLSEKQLEQVLETAIEVYRWVLICNDPPPMSILGRMCEAAQLAEASLSGELPSEGESDG